MASADTPMMARYREVKAEHPDALLLFRMGDFYELFFEDAEVAAKALGLTLTSRDKGSENPVPMAGFPHPALRGHVAKLIRRGFRVAVCEQMEDPKRAKGLVRREVTRVVTPGTLTDDELLDPRASNHLAAVYRAKGVHRAKAKKSADPPAVGLAWLEVSTGKFVAADLPEADLADELARLAPAEVLIAEGTAPPPGLGGGDALVTERPAFAFGRDQAVRRLTEHFGTATLAGFDLDEGGPGVAAAAALLEYAAETQRAALPHITRLAPHRCDDCLRIDAATRRSLELTRTLQGGERAGSLLDVLDDTVTAMGARRLADWLAEPLTDRAKIERRLAAVDELHADPVLLHDVRDRLSRAYDLERLAARVATRRAGPRDLAGLSATLALLPKLKARLADRAAELLNEAEDRIDLCPEVRADVAAALVDDPPVQTGEGGMIRPGFHAELDELRGLARGGKRWIAEYRAREAERTGIGGLKVGFNKVFGYYLEVTKAHQDRVPEDYNRKQTLKDRERYITPELKEYEEKVLRAEERAVTLESDLFTALRERVAGHVARLQATAAVLAELDVLACFAQLAVRHDYCRPTLTDDPVLHVTAGRHPVLDILKPGGGEFVPNDTMLGDAVGQAVPDAGDRSAVEPGSRQAQPDLQKHGRVHLITGPNMAGKSTYIRQAALVTILAQTGSFVPAASAVVGVADRVFARVGAGDDLGRGQSTFMVEMTEAARILNAATDRSLVILDEIGRGTSTYDGLSLAWAVTEHLHDAVRCRTLFATHYHELTGLSERLDSLSNWNVSVVEENGRVVFLHRIVPGAADRSYGIHVAELAGVPRPVLDRAAALAGRPRSEGAGPRRRPARPPRAGASRIGRRATQPVRRRRPPAARPPAGPRRRPPDPPRRPPRTARPAGRGPGFVGQAVPDAITGIAANAHSRQAQPDLRVYTNSHRPHRRTPPWPSSKPSAPPRRSRSGPGGRSR